MAAKDDKSLVKTGEGTNVPSFLQERIDETQGMGNSMSAQDNTTPFLAILQSNSPQVEENKPEYIEGAKKGMIFNTATKELFDGKTGVDVIAFGFQKVFNEWVPRSAGGGFVASYSMEDPIKDAAKPREVDGKKRGLMLSNGNDLVETLYTGVLLPGSPMPAIIGATSTALKPMRDWMTLRNNTLIGGKPAPAFARRYTLTTVYQENESGSWYNWKVTAGDWVSQEEFERALKFAKLMASGEFNIGRPPEPTAPEDTKDDVPV